MSAILEVEKIKKYYGQEAVLAGMDLAVKEGEFDNLQIARNNGAAVVLVTHDQKYAEQADRIFELKEGTLCERSLS
ncbi:MAG: hypothetical protein LLG02_00980 [Pelosinus sp.]|nr:hypothetical protein [Pelosinus sp.]